jgi:hypothetical protein
MRYFEVATQLSRIPAVFRSGPPICHALDAARSARKMRMVNFPIFAPLEPDSAGMRLVGRGVTDLIVDGCAGEPG